MISNDPGLDRREAMHALLEKRRELVLVTGLGSTTWDAAAVGDDDRNFYLWGRWVPQQWSGSVWRSPGRTGAS
jgi:hypothetical protein